MTRKFTNHFIIGYLFLFSAASYCVAAHLPESVEWTMDQENMQQDSRLGFKLKPNTVTELKKYQNGKLIYTNTVTINNNGFRSSTMSNRKLKSKHLLLIGGSQIFGAGLGDEETISHWVNKKSDEYESYPVGFNGYQLPQSWVIFDSKELANKVSQKKGKAIIYLSEPSILTNEYKLNRLQYRIENWPYVEKNENGEFSFKGIYKEQCDLLTTFFINYCLPIEGCKMFLVLMKPLKTDDLFVRTIELVESIKKMYHQQFESDDFSIAWGEEDEDLSLEKLKSLTNIPIFKWPKFETYADGHPTPAGAKKMADFLFEKKIVY